VFDGFVNFDFIPFALVIRTIKFHYVGTLWPVCH